MSPEDEINGMLEKYTELFKKYEECIYEITKLFQTAGMSPSESLEISLKYVMIMLITNDVIPSDASIIFQNTLNDYCNIYAEL